MRKTTLMMQLASQVEFNGHKLVCDFLTEDKAKLIVRKLQGERALVFVDDCADSIEAFNSLLEADNIVTIGFDRDYSYERASHKIRGASLKVLDVSEITARDMQEVFSVIPATIRKPTLVTPAMEPGIGPSLYEFVENNINQARLSQRFKGVLHELELNQPEVQQLLVMCCYVHACRTPVSFDMALAFMRGLIITYDELYENFDMLKNLVVGYIGDLVDSEQDHFTARSTLFSEAILQSVSAQSFKRVLLRFHREVSPFRICRYDVFRRRAFDAALAERAFPNWQEGMEFYDQQYLQHDRSPYLRQQGALYLTHKRKFREAFKWIDEAVLESEYRIPSIRNTHAIILFKANVNAPESDGTKRGTLDESMKILAECHSFDRRKLYHAVAFADQALQYFDLYADAAASNYLGTAARWLREEKRSNPWNRNIDRLLRQVDQRLQ
jgi:hypothetical protein